MPEPEKITIKARWPSGEEDEFDVPYNPTEFTLEKGAQLSEVPIPGIDTPLLQFVRGQNERMTLELFFDTTEDGMGDEAVSVTQKTDQLYQLVKIEPESHAPPICTFTWGEHFPGADVSETLGSQMRSSFQFIVENISQKFTLFSPQGVPLRARLTLTLREYKTLDEQLDELNLSSPDRTHSHVVQQGDTLASIANSYYQGPDAWRSIADENDIHDARRLTPGTFLTVPPTS